jgi:hypothetical protein
VAFASQRSHSQKPSSRHRDAQQTDLRSWFLVSDDEGDDEKCHMQPRRSQVLAEDFSPIPVRSLSTGREESLLDKPMKVATESLNLAEYSRTRAGVLLHDRTGTQLQPLNRQFALKPRNTICHAHDTRFSTKAWNCHEAKSWAFPSSNLNESNTDETLNPVDFKHFRNAVDSSPSHLLENSTAHKTTTGHSSEANCESSQKQVTFSMTTQSSTSSSALHRRPRVRSESIAIKKRGYACSSTTIQEESSNEDSISHNERMYDNATWLMYHRIVDHRRRQQLQRRQHIEHDDGVPVDSRETSSKPVTQPHDVSTSQASMMLLPSESGLFHPHSTSSVSGNSSIASSNLEDDDDEIFDMEL